MWEASRDWGAAVDAYLSLLAPTPAHDIAACEAAWLSAVRLAGQWQRDRWMGVCEEVAHRLAENGRWEAAGGLFRDLGQPDRACDCYVRGGAWKLAREAAAGNAALSSAVEGAARKAAIASGSGDEMRAAGALEAALASYSAAGQYDKLFEAAGQAGAGVLAKYLYPRAAELLAGDASAPPSHARGLEVLAYLEKYGAPPEAGALPIYVRLCRALFHADSGHVYPPPLPLLTRARAVLYKLVAALRRAGAGANPVGTVLAEFEHCLLAVHYAEMRCILEGAGAPELAARAAATLLRFTDLLPADAAFFDAGCAARSAGDKSSALVLLNRFIDLSVALEEGERDSACVEDGGELRDAGFLAPGAFPLPPRPYVSSKAREEANTWVLATSMDRKVSAALASRACSSCGRAQPACALVCAGCTSVQPACVVTGAPIPAAQLVECPGCGSKASTVAWAAMVGKTRTCCWCACPAK